MVVGCLKCNKDCETRLSNLSNNVHFSQNVFGNNVAVVYLVLFYFTQRIYLTNMYSCGWAKH